MSLLKFLTGGLLHPRDGTWPFSEKEWFSLPLSLRQRWWEETDYGSERPSEELLKEIRRELDGSRV